MTIHCIPPILSDKYQRTKAFYPNLGKKKAITQVFIQLYECQFTDNSKILN